jgi:Tol biopolymer transport system component
MPTARNGELLYIRPLGGNASHDGRLFVMRSDGSAVRDVTPAGIVNVDQASWSPDGNRIAFAGTAAGTGDPEIYVVSADASQLRQLTSNHVSDRMPSWSPDGRTIVFASLRTGLFQIYSMRSDGRRQRRLTDQVEDCVSPAWSPNGGWIVASCQLGAWKLLLLRPDGSGERRLLRGDSLGETSPTWTPQGQILFARGARRPAGRGIFVARADGSGLRRISPTGGYPTASPDGRFIAFVWTPDGGGNHELFVMRSDGTAPRQLTGTNGVTEGYPDWQPR